jgi:hypothetical protein
MREEIKEKGVTKPVLNQFFRPKIIDPCVSCISLLLAAVSPFPGTTTPSTGPCPTQDATTG